MIINHEKIDSEDQHGQNPKAGCEAVNAIDKVEGVDDDDDREVRECKCERFG
jgi:hypothetical protein